MSILIDNLLENGASFAGVTRLLRNWGGLPLSVPLKPDPQHQIAQIAGFDTMCALCQLYAGERVTMPLGRRLIRELQRRDVEDLLRAGLTKPQIARRLGLHVRQVLRLANSPAAFEQGPAASDDGPQLGLCLDGGEG